MWPSRLCGITFLRIWILGFALVMRQWCMVGSPSETLFSLVVLAVAVSIQKYNEWCVLFFPSVATPGKTRKKHDGGNHGYPNIFRVDENQENPYSLGAYAVMCGCESSALQVDCTDRISCPSSRIIGTQHLYLTFRQLVASFWPPGDPEKA